MCVDAYMIVHVCFHVRLRLHVYMCVRDFSRLTYHPPSHTHTPPITHTHTYL